MWFTETPWPPVALLVTAAVGLLLLWSRNRRALFLGLAGLCLLGGLAVVAVERMIVTPAEEVELRVLALRDAVANDDAEATAAFFSPTAVRERLLVRGAMAMGRIAPDARITDLAVTTQADDTLAQSLFRANGTITAKRGDWSGHIPTRWRLGWRKEAGEWKVFTLERLHPTTDEPIGLVSGSR